MMAKSISALEFHYPMNQFLIMTDISKQLGYDCYLIVTNEYTEPLSVKALLRGPLRLAPPRARMPSWFLPS